MGNTGPYNIKVDQVQKGHVPNAWKEKNGRKCARVPIVRKHSYLGRSQKQAWVNQGQILILITLNAPPVAYPCCALEWIRSKLLILSHTCLSKSASSAAATAVWLSPVVSPKLSVSIVFAETLVFQNLVCDRMLQVPHLAGPSWKWIIIYY